ncbi:MAG: hypothetical protein LC799_18305 [Actinobacteria bacterium]|nr:hypothetical protein [Actinomycetota bacterium]
MAPATVGAVPRSRRAARGGRPGALAPSFATLEPHALGWIHRCPVPIAAVALDRFPARRPGVAQPIASEHVRAASRRPTKRPAWRLHSRLAHRLFVTELVDLIVDAGVGPA